MINESDRRIVEKLVSKMRTESIIWIVIAIFQILSLVGIVCGIYNLVVSIMNLNTAKRIREYPVGVVRSFEPMAGNLIIMCLNIFLGAFIGIVGSLYHIFGVRGYVMDNRDAFLRVEAALTGQSPAN